MMRRMPCWACAAEILRARNMFSMRRSMCFRLGMMETIHLLLQPMEKGAGSVAEK